MRTWFVAARRWLSNIDVADPVDRRNAPVLQVLLLLVGVMALSNSVLYLVAASSSHRAIPADKAFAVAAMLIVGAVSWGSLLLIRIGRLRLGVKVFIAALLVALAIIYSRIGVQFLANEPLALLPLGIGGLVLGRQTLWIVFASLTAISLAAVGFELGRMGGVRGDDVVPLAGMAMASIVTFLLIALLLDRTVAALRESLAESNVRGAELAQALARLQVEMAERERAQDQLVHAQKMEVAGRLASGIAHDFGNVLAIISGFASRRDALADRGVDALLNALKGIETASRRADIINRRLLNFSRSETQASRFDAALALRELQPMIRQLFPSRVEVVVEDSEGEAWVFLDRAHFELAIFNIASNARDAMVGEGVFRLACRLDAGGDVHVLAQDTGVGIAPEVLPQVFEAFYTTKPVGQGTGIGLSMTREMLVRAGGSISVRSTSGQGTCFTICLPAAPGLADSATAVANPRG